MAKCNNYVKELWINLLRENGKMNEVIRNELKNWCETLNIDDLNEYDISVINIILNHYDELIEAGGTAGGKRANKFVEYVNEKEGVCDKELET